MATETEKNETFRLEVNESILVTFESLGRKMKMTLVDIAEGGCRLSSTACVPADRVSFKWTGPSQQALGLYGEIVGGTITDEKVPQVAVDFDMPVVERDKLAAELHEIQRRLAFKPIETKAEGGSTRRQAYRAPIKFPVSVKIPNRARELQGEANDLSIGGCLLNTGDDIQEGTVVEIAFDLPIEEVALAGEVREVNERGPSGAMRKVKKTVPIPPFETFHVKLKIVKKIGSTPTGYSFGTAFHDMKAFDQEEIARFVHAYQLAQLRKAAALEK